MSRIRIASIQYYIRPVARFEEFAAQVRGLVETAADYGCRLAVFPEYFTVQLLTLGDVRRPIDEQVRHLASHGARYRELLSQLASEHDIYLVGGSIPTRVDEGEEIRNTCHVFGPGGEWGTQGKIHMTRFEKEEWLVAPTERLRIFDTSFGRLAVAICYDVEFPEIARAAARAGANVLAVPSCTDDRQGFLRVRYCAQARAIENQMYVIHSPTVGSLPMVPAVSLNYGRAAVFTPSDFSFARDGILAQGNYGDEMMIVAELDLEIIEQSRTTGTVLPLLDSERTAELVRDPEVVELS